MTDFHWRPMRESDLDGVAAVAAIAFPGHFEERACFAERLALFPDGCFVLAAPDGIIGYLIAYPWAPGAIPPLNSLLGSLPATAEAVYLHDLALHPDARGQGAARPMIERLAANLRSLGTRQIALVAVNGSVPFWQTMGFAPVHDDPSLTGKLQSYGGDATYLTRPL
ncbi:GNAT family N-acetyltransferase [Sphingomonas sp. LY54]|uniref:GNAT family N-acetyltransferase n=1 Tax=Sphingomonas sp. LY54 TaxID=3095343 RepID=UPI002D77A1BC|nr:GNAT family N-acetyltransferase [Sphingomonas sp. LY54]WRP29495.1 GNAT family N-acetyltransferase [Sphingomonas sp. LY54]